jgi:hypothetical protein
LRSFIKIQPEYVVKLLVERMPGLRKLSSGDNGNEWEEPDDDPKFEERA